MGYRKDHDDFRIWISNWQKELENKIPTNHWDYPEMFVHAGKTLRTKNGFLIITPKAIGSKTLIGVDLTLHNPSGICILKENTSMYLHHEPTTLNVMDFPPKIREFFYEYFNHSHDIQKEKSSTLSDLIARVKRI